VYSAALARIRVFRVFRGLLRDPCALWRPPFCAPVVIFVVPPISSPGPTPTSSFRVAIAVIPARYHSTRLPGKALADIGGRPMIEHVYRRASEARTVSSVIVATDDVRIARAVTTFGGEARMTAASHRSGTDRLAEVAATLTCDLVVNVQGDEPLIEPAMIDEAVAPFAADANLRMSTLRQRIDDPADLRNPNVTKVVVDREGYALYFSRAPIPHVREDSPAAPAWRHIGMYVYRRDCLLELARLAPTELEQSEALEQLRALEHGIRIKAVETQHDSIGVDTPEDLERVRRILARSGGAEVEVGRA
jgi:3-deoxy-manno-octulosonate cytidylyltransferase (CMP-KDO synthetase)